MSWLDALIEARIREAQQRGEFDDLPGAGKPLPGHGEPYDPDWWIKGLVQRENLGGSALPTALRLRKEAEDLLASLDREPSEQAVRQRVAGLNARIVAARRAPADGPPVLVHTLDVEDVVRAWRTRRADPAAGSA